MASAEESSPSLSASRFQTVQAMIALLVSVSALIGYGMTYVGRRFIIGYYQALHIPTSLITLSTWDTAEIGGVVLLVSSLLVLIILCVEWGLLGLAQYLTTCRLRARLLYLIILGISGLIGMWVGNQGVILSAWTLFAFTLVIMIAAAIELSPPAFTQSLDIVEFFRRFWILRLALWSLLFLFPVAIFIGLLIAIEGFAIQQGRQAGQTAVRQAQRIRVLSEEPLPLLTSPTITTTTHSRLFVYDDLHFLLLNNDHYYVFLCMDAHGEPGPVSAIPLTDEPVIELLPPAVAPTLCTPAPTNTTTTTPSIP